MTRLAKAFDAIERGVSLLSSAVIFAVMIVVSFDVFMRYVMNAPLRWSYDAITLYGLLAIFYFSVSSAYTQNYHLRLDVLYVHFPERLKIVINILGLLATIALIAWIAKINFDEALRASRQGLAISGRYAWPVWPVKAITALGFGLLTVRLLIDLIRNGHALFPSTRTTA